MSWRPLVCLLLALSVSACGGDSPTAPSLDVSGRWQGTLETTNDQPGTITLQLTQSGLNVTGSALLTQNEFTNVPAALTGTLASASASTTMQFTLTYEFGADRCQGTFRGTLNVTTSEIGGSFSGQNCIRTFAGSMRTTKS
jgi:hypothetical protein